MIDAQESAAQRNDGERVRAKTLAPHRQAQRDSPQLLQPGAPQPGAHRGAANYVGRHLWGTSRHTLALPQTTRDTCLSPQGGKMLAASRREGSPRPGGGSHPSGRWGRGGPSASLQAAACLVCGEAFPTPGRRPWREPTPALLLSASSWQKLDRPHAPVLPCSSSLSQGGGGLVLLRNFSLSTKSWGL